MNYIFFLSGPFLVSRTGDAGCSERKVAVPNSLPNRYHKECELMKTIRRWPWKQEIAKECVTAH